LGFLGASNPCCRSKLSRLAMQTNTHTHTHIHGDGRQKSPRPHTPSPDGLSPCTTPSGARTKYSVHATHMTAMHYLSPSWQDGAIVLQCRISHARIPSQVPPLSPCALLNLPPCPRCVTTRRGVRHCCGREHHKVVTPHTAHCDGVVENITKW
jgi:hypothetical protein